MIVGAFYTKDTPYEEEIKNTLWPSLEKFNLKYIIKEVENLGSWQKNVAQKPKIIGELLELNEEILFVDGDAEFLRYPELIKKIPKEFDIACHFLNWETWYGYKGDTTRELLSGTMLLRPRQNVKDLCKKWYEQAIESNLWEQKVLSNIIKEQKIKIYELPIEYCFINTRPGGSPPFISDKNAVIKHYQASRRFKRLINRL